MQLQRPPQERFLPLCLQRHGHGLRTGNRRADENGVPRIEISDDWDTATVAGADVNAQDNEGKTALMIAPDCGSADVAELLKAAGAR